MDGWHRLMGAVRGGGGTPKWYTDIQKRNLLEKWISSIHTRIKPTRKWQRLWRDRTIGTGIRIQWFHWLPDIASVLVCMQRIPCRWSYSMKHAMHYMHTCTHLKNTALLRLTVVVLKPSDAHWRHQENVGQRYMSDEFGSWVMFGKMMMSDDWARNELASK